MFIINIMKESSHEKSPRKSSSDSGTGITKLQQKPARIAGSKQILFELGEMRNCTGLLRTEHAAMNNSLTNSRNSLKNEVL